MGKDCLGLGLDTSQQDGQEGSEPHFGVDVASGRFHWRRREKKAESPAGRDDGEEEREKSSWQPLFKSLSST
jgi:hypothetical protein